ncbi:hypothetical protein LINPERPRIM_LOCUS17483 [Linum perenne]
MGYDRVLFETDSLQVAKAINGGTSDVTEFGRLITECRTFIDSRPFYKVIWGRRDRNVLAHELAHRSRFLVSPILGETPPRWSMQYVNRVCFDLNH